MATQRKAAAKKAASKRSGKGSAAERAKREVQAAAAKKGKEKNATVNSPPAKGGSAPLGSTFGGQTPTYGTPHGQPVGTGQLGTGVGAAATSGKDISSDRTLSGAAQDENQRTLDNEASGGTRSARRKAR